MRGMNDGVKVFEELDLTIDVSTAVEQVDVGHGTPLRATLLGSNDVTEEEVESFVP